MATRRGPDNTVRFSISGLNDTVPWANVMWANLTLSGTPTQANLDAWLTTVSNAYKTRFSGYAQSSVSYTQAQAILFLPGLTVLPSLIAMTGAGTGANTALDPTDVCAVISWQTGVYWRGGKPRTYLPGLTTVSRTNKHQLTAAQITALTGDAGTFITNVNAATSGAITGTALGFTSFRTGNADRVPPVFFPYVGAKVHPRIGTQRRRLGRWTP